MGKELATYPVFKCQENFMSKLSYDLIGSNVNAKLQLSSIRHTESHNFATWNVRGLSEGKLEVVKREMRRLDIDLLGVSELHWINSGFFRSDDFVIYYSGNINAKRNGVAFIASKKIAPAIESRRIFNDRIILIHVRGRPLNITVMQVYAPTFIAKDDEIDQFYYEFQEALKLKPKKDIIYIMGDFNSKVGCIPHTDIVGSFGLGKRNDAGDRLVQFCQENGFQITNTWFKQHKRRLYTWTSPNGMSRDHLIS